MLLLAWNTFRDRWQVFAGAILTVCLGVALVQSSFLMLMAAATTPTPSGISDPEAMALREALEGVLVVTSMQLALATFVAVFIVSSTFSFAVSQRRQELALLRLTGANRKQIRSLLVGEALLLGLVGSTLGAILGVPATRFQVWMFDFFDFLPPGFEAQWRSWVLFISLGTGVLIAILGVLAASRRASGVRPLEALRDSGEAARVMTWSRWTLGLLFIAAAVVLFLIFPAGDAKYPVWFIQLTPFLVTVPLVIGFSALAPLVVPLVGRLFGLFVRGPVGELALANLRFDAQRSASTAAPIMLLFAVVASIGGTLDSISEADRESTLNTVQGDLIVTTDEPAAAELASVEGVQLVSEETLTLIEITFSSYGEEWVEPHQALAADPSTYTETRDIDATEGTLTDLTGSTIAVSPMIWEREWDVGETIEIIIDGEDHEVEVVALLPEFLSEPFFLLSPDLVPDDAGPWQHIVQLTNGADESDVAALLSEIGTVESLDEWISEASAEQEQLTFNILVILLGMTMVYTVIAMINAVVISASDRRREFASARVTGLKRRQVVHMAFWESQAVVFIGVFLGSLATAGSIWGTSLAVENLAGVSVISLQWPLLISLALGSAVIVGVTNAVTTVSATRTPPIRLVASRE